MKHNVFRFFEEILSIPRMSGKEEKISNYVVAFAKERNLEVYQDELYNVIIKRKNEDSQNHIILQCHIDMVCEKEPDIDFDFENQGINWYIEDGFYKAKGTTLGADNGAGLAIILALLTSRNQFPNIEAVFTVEEETTMNGAKGLDYSLLKSAYLISLDGVEEGHLEVGCAGMCSMTIQSLFEKKEIVDNGLYELTIGGLLGGHSGDAIDKGRGNAIKIVGSCLSDISNIRILSIEGGSRNNVIPSYAKCLFQTDDPQIFNHIEKVKYELLEKGTGIGDNPNITVSKLNSIPYSCYSIEDSQKIIQLLTGIPNGVLKREPDGFPITSSNLGVIKEYNNKLSMEVTIRSSDKESEKYSLQEVERHTFHNDFSFHIDTTAPFFPYNKDSILRSILSETYENLYNKPVVLEKIHACMEGGVFKEHMKELDICVAAPTIYDIHSVQERLDIKSAERVYVWIEETLKRLK